ncbi:dTDP-4-dehydrorhamnose reductase [Paenibacillus sp. ACRRX]|uniref:dTDP-4-dehydrorhamnose reductase n=1 Tax=unclassified Paenibacillus TaxID=185978 RepID=UPI001EF56874|nr:MULTISPECIES: dTDP-4-dehydrorhamnose reductase [unclassified Paenibacillus]MCG7408982.1 dTDP-4-dehydrorhamnose reductase [Paenibacillus sp. ACRRX]MDK8182019.1 dTDP-4-dehydrorhamnose reductase [Paenibacillus sp. UMB4589-SE434]
MIRKIQPILITGADGQLGRDIQAALDQRGIPYVACGRKQLDVTDVVAVMQWMRHEQPGAVIHAAAYTKVDEAESESDTAFRINAYGTRNIAAAAQAVGSKLMYVSTDYVFDGRSLKPYDEFARPRPINVYGASKWQGEQFIKQLHQRAFVVRTSWVFGRHGHNFVKSMMRLAREQSELQVVHDQFGCPTYTVDLAETIVNLLQSDLYGTYHVTNAGPCSWYDFASAIMKETGMQVPVRPVPTSQFPRPARRPSYSVMDGRALRLNGFQPLRHWQQALQNCVQELRQDGLCE